MKDRLKIFVIEHPDRVGLFQKEVDGQTIQEDIIVHSVPAILRNPAREGIAMSHMAIVKQAKEAALERVCIAEDDCQFFSPHALKHFIDQMPEDFDIYLGGLYAGSEKVTPENRLVGYFCGLHLYIVHSRFYDQFLRADSYMDSIDNALSRLALAGKARIVACYPFAAVQREMVSTNSGIIFRHKAFFNTQNTLGFPVK